LALESGEAGNLQAGETLNIVSAIPDVDGVATVSSITTEAEDQETLEEYRARVIERYQKRPQGGALIDYNIWAREVPGITRSFSYRVDPGFIAVYPIEDGGATRIPSAAKLAEVDAYINDPSRRPLQALTVVAAMTEVVFNVDISNLIPDTTDIRAEIEQNVEEFLLSRQPQQFLNEQNLKNVISEATMISIAIQSGAQSLDLVLKQDTTPVSSYTLGNNELAILGSVTFL
jgi:uncharacterized phage protein gp47/JayE